MQTTIKSFSFRNTCRLVAGALIAATLSWTPVQAQPATSSGQGSASRDLTFFVVSDTHYGQTPRGDETIPQLVDKMNALPGTAYPDAIGGTVDTPRGVIHIGDTTNDGKTTNWLHFVRDYGLTGKDGRLKYPVYETFGNHDGGKGTPVRNGIIKRNKERVGLTNVSTNGLLYSWDWDTIHFVMMGISPGTTKNPYDPVFSTAFVEQDLAKNVGNSGRPVILMHHFGFDKEHSWGWWPDDWKIQYRDVIKKYNVIGILHGHAHKPFIYKWEGFDIYHPPHFQQKDPKQNGPVTHGFFVFHIHGNEMTVAERKLDDTWGMTSKKSIDWKMSTEAP